MSIWQSCAYCNYVDYIERLGGIYYTRWGDAPIKSLAVSMFVPWAETYNFKDIGYKHKALNTLDLTAHYQDQSKTHVGPGGRQ